MLSLSLQVNVFYTLDYSLVWTLSNCYWFFSCLLCPTLSTLNFAPRINSWPYKWVRNDKLTYLWGLLLLIWPTVMLVLLYNTIVESCNARCFPEELNPVVCYSWLNIVYLTTDFNAAFSDHFPSLKYSRILIFSSLKLQSSLVSVIG